MKLIHENVNVYKCSESECIRVPNLYNNFSSFRAHRQKEHDVETSSTNVSMIVDAEDSDFSENISLSHCVEEISVSNENSAMEDLFEKLLADDLLNLFSELYSLKDVPRKRVVGHFVVDL